MNGAIKLARSRSVRFGLVVRAHANGDDLALAESVIDRSRIAPRIETTLDDARVHGSGRPRELPVRTLLVALLTLAMAGQPLHLRRAYELLANLDPGLRRRLGAERADGSCVTERQVVHLFRRICAVHDVSEHTAPDLDAGVRAARERALQGLLDDLLGATLPDPDIGPRQGRSYALDATTIPAWARGWRSTARRRDRDAGWTVKRADGSTAIDVTGGDAKPRRGRRRDEFVFGYEVHAFTWVRDDDQPTGSVPALTERIAVFGGGKSDMDRIAPIIEQLATVRPLHDVVVDRWYSQHLAERFALRARRAGAALVFDLKTDQAGPDGTYRGALKLDGELYCPALPAGLHALPDAYYKDVAARSAREGQAALREPYRLLPVAAPDTDGHQRLRCQAAGPNPKLRCPLKPASLAKPAATTVTVLTPTAAPGDCCNQVTITVPPAVNDRTRQKHPWATEPWRRSFARRSNVEGPFGVLKTAGGIGVKRDHIRVMGLTAFSLLIAVYFAAVNLLHRLRFEERQAAATATAAETVQAPTRRKPRRPTAGFDELIAGHHGTPVPAD